MRLVNIRPGRQTRFYLLALPFLAAVAMVFLRARPRGQVAWVAAAAPLLGLLGTVIGMIEIFAAGEAQMGSGGNTQQLAHGISIALYNTAFGLIVAIPSLMAYRYFRGRVDAYTLELEMATERLVPHLMRFATGKAG